MHKKSSSIYEYTSFNKSIITLFVFIDVFELKFFSRFKDCPKECDYTSFKTSVNTADYPTDYYAGILILQPKIVARFNHDIYFVPYDKAEETTTQAPTTEVNKINQLLKYFLKCFSKFIFLRQLLSLT